MQILVFFSVLATPKKHYARFIRLSVWTSTELGDFSSVFQIFSFLESESAFVTILFGFNPIPVNFLDVL